MNNTIKLPVFGITLILTETDDGISGSITSDLQEPIYSPDYSAIHSARMDGIESLILALACEGVDVESTAFLTAIETAVIGAS